MSTAATLENYDIAMVCISLGIFALYHINLYIVLPYYSEKTVPFLTNMQNSTLWIQKHKEMNESATILLAIQTLRNTMMAAVFIGGNALNFAYVFANDFKNVTDPAMQLRSVAITTFMFLSFMCWANVIRIASVLGFLIGTMQYSEKKRNEYSEKADVELGNIDDQEKVGFLQTPTKVLEANGKTYGSINSSTSKPERAAVVIPDTFEAGSVMIQLMTFYFSFGFRMIFVSIPFAFYSVGPSTLLLTSIGIWFFLYSYDSRHFKQN